MQVCVFTFNRDFSGTFNANSEFKENPLEVLPLIAEGFRKLVVDHAMKRFHDDKLTMTDREAYVSEYIKTHDIDTVYENRNWLLDI